MPKIYVRILPKTGTTKRFRCNHEFGADWREVTADEATIAAFKADQMLEVTDTLPEGAEARAENTAEKPEQRNATAATPEEIHEAHLINAILYLNKEDKGIWMENGAPKTEAIKELFGFKISAKERDAVWAFILENDLFKA